MPCSRIANLAVGVIMILGAIGKIIKNTNSFALSVKLPRILEQHFGIDDIG